MKRILILTNSDGGLYHFRKELIEALLREGYEIYISLPFGIFASNLEHMGCKLIETAIDRRGVNPAKDLKLLLQYFKIIKQTCPDVVLTYTIKPNIYGSLACRFHNVACMNNITGLGSSFLNEGLLSRILVPIYRGALRRSKTVFFQNASDMNYMLANKMVSGEYKLIPGSGVNLAKFGFATYPPDTGTLIFNFIGRVMKDKGIDEYLTAAETIRGKYPSTHFNVIGYVEPSQAHYETILKEHEEKGHIKFWGYQKDIIPLITASHCTVQPSYSEGMSNVLLESAAIGRVLIGSDIPGCREIIENRVNGFTFEVRNADNLVERLEQFIRLPYEHKARMGERSRDKVELEFDRQIVLDNYLDRVNTICSNTEFTTQMEIPL